MLARKYLVFWVFVAAFFGLIFIMLNLKATQLVSLPVTPISTVCPSVSSQLYPTNSRFVVTKSSSAYEANPDPACWLQDCKMRNNHKAYRGCTDNFANDWNALGVISMERYLNAEIINLPDYNSKSLMDAIWYFKNATAVQKDCAVAWMNLGISQMQKQLYTDALESLNKVCLSYVLHRNSCRQPRIQAQEDRFSMFEILQVKFAKLCKRIFCQF